MGVLNVTPDSFSDGGLFQTRDAALRQAEAMLLAGASLIDVGAESTRPGAAPVSEQQELDRLLPVVEAIATQLDVIISVDTSSAKAMTEAAKLGAGMINDVRALQQINALAAAAATGLPICLMHMQGQPNHMQQAPQYNSVIDQVSAFLAERINACVAAGIARERLLIDPGFGFGKTLDHNLQLLAQLSTLKDLGLPLLIGLSRKSMLGAVLGGAAVNERLYAGLSAAVLSLERGARIIRSHDVKATKDAITLWQAQRPWSAQQ
ncbi:MAG: dihydropteroate synthase [Moraxellaceae bacterium]|nr:dihydropteroate synthase [Moraxellaceae bacterium]MDZ4386095.1 dihydropteroate synthase [Moraxellaceae bacterium]